MEFHKVLNKQMTSNDSETYRSLHAVSKALLGVAMIPMSFVHRKELLPQSKTSHTEQQVRVVPWFVRSFVIFKLQTSVEHWGSAPHLTRRRWKNSLRMSNPESKAMGYGWLSALWWCFFLQSISTTESWSTLTWCSVNTYEITLGMLKQCLA